MLEHDGVNEESAKAKTRKKQKEALVHALRLLVLVLVKLICAQAEKGKTGYTLLEVVNMYFEPKSTTTLSSDPSSASSSPTASPPS